MARTPKVAELRSRRPPQEHGEWFGFVVPALAAALSAVFIWLVLFGDAPQRRPVTVVVNPVVMTVLVVVTGKLLRLPGLGHGERRAWRALFAAFAMFLTGGLLGLAAQFGAAPPLRGVRQILVVTAFGAMVFALFRFPAAPQTKLPRARFVLDAATVFAATTMFLWHFAIAPQLGSGGMDGGLAALMVAVFGAMAVVVVVLAMLLLRERTPGTRSALMRLIVGVGIVLGVSIIAVGRGMGGGAQPLWSIALNWTAMVLVVSAAVQQHRGVVDAVVAQREEEPRAVLQLSYVAVVLAFGFLLVAGLREAPLQLKGVLVGAAVVGTCVLVRQRLLLHENETLRAALERQAEQDPLTGLRNRRAWEAEAEKEVARAARASAPLCVAMFDLDGFKAINDRYGHAVGDEMLRLVAQCFAGGLRSSDMPARIGGDEFVLLLPDTGLADAVLLVDAVLARLARSRLWAGDVELAANVSVGVAAMPPAGSLRELVAQADAAMYAAKRDGGGCVRASVGPLARIRLPVGQHRV